MAKSKKRKYYRTCPYCGKKLEQSQMIRTNESPTGWICKHCFDKENFYDWDEGYSSNGN